MIALITVVGSLIVSIIGLVATRNNGRRILAIQEDTRASRAQVENSHTTNLRVEQDDRHGEIIARFDKQDRRIGGIESDIRGLRKDIGRLDDKGEKLDERIHDLETNER